jgi:ABC-type Fe3+-hydroxamate transport system substrate-binding protein
VSRPPAPQRIVSLVPSLTEALFALGLGDRVVGVTDWCVHPRDGLAGLPRVGGSRTPSVERILGLQPDLVIANREENRRRDVERLEAAGIRVWVTYPRSVSDGARLLRELAALGAAADMVEAVVVPVERALEAALARRPARATRAFCPIWKKPWMAVGGGTYADDLLSLCGGRNVFAARAERRYPVVELADIVRAKPEVVLLPDEPYAFGPRDVEELAGLDIPAARDGRIHLIDGTWVSWYGPRIARALQILRPLISGEHGP